MNVNDLKQLLKLPTPNTKGKKPHPLLVWGILGAIIFLAISGFSDGKEKSKEQKSLPAESSQVMLSKEEYLSQLESRLVRVLEEIEGVGKVQVFLSVESGGTKVLATDVKNESEEKNEEDQNEVHYQKEETVVFVEGNSGQSPYIIEEKMPQPSGILVVAEGAREEHVRMEIYEAVKALFGLPAHRIKVSY